MYGALLGREGLDLLVECRPRQMSFIWPAKPRIEEHLRTNRCRIRNLCSVQWGVRLGPASRRDQALGNGVTHNLPQGWHHGVQPELRSDIESASIEFGAIVKERTGIPSEGQQPMAAGDARLNIRRR